MFSQPRSRLLSAVHSPHRSNYLRIFTAALLILAALLTAARWTGAIYSDSQAVTANTFVTGIVDISASPASAVVSFTGMVPGDKVTAPLQVNNGGTIQFRYAVTSTTTENVLAGELDFTIKSGVSTCTNAGFGASGASVYATNDLGSTTGINVIGNPSQGAQAGDRVLNAAANETLCLQVELPLASAIGQGITTTATLNFQAEQTANN